MAECKKKIFSPKFHFLRPSQSHNWCDKNQNLMILSQLGCHWVGKILAKPSCQNQRHLHKHNYRSEHLQLFLWEQIWNLYDYLYIPKYILIHRYFPGWWKNFEHCECASNRCIDAENTTECFFMDWSCLTWIIGKDLYVIKKNENLICFVV